MARFHLLLLFSLLFLHQVSSLKFFTLVQPYLIQAPSTTFVKKEDQEELPVYRDLPPIKKETKDITEALEATRSLKFTRPPLDTEAFFASLKKAAEEARSVVFRIAPPFSNVQIRKYDVMDVAEKSDGIKDEQVAKSSNEAFEDSPKAQFKNYQVKRSDGSYITYQAEDTAASDLDVHVKAPFTDVQVSKQAVEEGGTEVPIPDTEPPVYGPNPDAGVGVRVDAPFTNVRVQKYGASGGQVGVRVQAPFTNVKVRKQAADIPASGIPDGYPGAVPDVGVKVEAPFVRVKVDAPVKIPDGVVVKGQGPIPDDGLSFHGRKGRPLNLDINIPGIFNLKLLRDANGRGRLGIGVLPSFTSFVNQHPASDTYPGPPPS